MNIKSLLRSGYTFTPNEYELETKYMVTNAILYFMLLVYPIPIFLYYLNDSLEKSGAYILAMCVTLFSIYFARVVGKDNYTKLVYLSVSLYTLAIFYGYYVEPNYTPVSAWILILIITSFLVTNIITGVYISVGYFGYLLFMNTYILQYHSYEYILLEMAPITIGLFVVYMFEQKFITTILLLEKSNTELELKVEERTKALKDEKEQLDYQAHYDFLTDLPNRNKFHKEIQEWISFHAQAQTHFSLFFIDLDRFKRVNDSLGHSAGDKVLQIVASRVKELIHTDAFFSRISGDEFTLLLAHNTDINEVKSMAIDLIKTIEKPIEFEESKLYISASIGISCYPENAQYHKDLIKYADTTMFEAKVAGRGTFKFYDEEMTHKVKEMVLMETEIYEALDKNEFILSFQPQVDMRTDTISGMEVLVRWRHPKLGMFLPNDFIPLAEDTGAIIALDYYILRKGMEQIVVWKKMGYDIPRISFNFSTKHLHQKGFVLFIEELLVETGCKGEWVELEITESHIVSNIEESIVILNTLKSLGITISIDDFGTGYSSLTYLKRLPADKLKIDKSFIEKISDNEVDMTITKAIIEIANSMGLTVIAEGVETEAQKEYLMVHECYHVQGHFYYEAMLTEEIEEKGIFTITKSH